MPPPVLQSAIELVHGLALVPEPEPQLELEPEPEPWLLLPRQPVTQLLLAHAPVAQTPTPSQ